jgi:hypothetical protein
MAITKERAEEIRKKIWADHGWTKVGTCPTKDENDEIQRFWSRLPNNTSYYDVVSRMARGDHLTEEGE